MIVNNPFILFDNKYTSCNFVKINVFYSESKLLQIFTYRSRVVKSKNHLKIVLNFYIKLLTISILQIFIKLKNYIKLLL
ncbi:hypothetical protein EMA8858_01059 [Emticicia aquatica]|uniref:Uncharacterized protein n=1 Tax=Emticicia aquatica TaxID=1681835 RepID=A0ABM9AMV5_9BACT|nr:hypothetical protein EMA8858_01059 [Emticicia aquatica]